MSENKRNTINEILPSKIYQRGNILSWTREKKLELFKERNIRGVINFWPKIDHNIEDMDLDFYFYIPVPRSENMLAPHIIQAAAYVDNYLKTHENSSVLILCEAGKTRSVCFAIMVLAWYTECGFETAYHTVTSKISTELKQFMKDFFLPGGKRD